MNKAKPKRKSRSKKRKNTRSWKSKLFLSLVGMISLSGIGLYLAGFFDSHIHYGIHIPQGFTTHGIDISQYQGKINWDTVCAPQDDNVPISFVYMRATMGLRTDKQFQYNWQETRKHGLKRGAYLYFHPHKDGVKQAELYIKRVGSLKSCLPPVVDIEKKYRVNNKTLRKRLQDCLNHLESHYGIKPIIYTYTTFYRDYLGADFDHYPLWIAHYEREDKPDYISRSWDIWQHSERGVLRGIDEFVDFNVWNSDSQLVIND